MCCPECTHTHIQVIHRQDSTTTVTCHHTFLAVKTLTPPRNTHTHARTHRSSMAMAIHMPSYDSVYLSLHYFALTFSTHTHTRAQVIHGQDGTTTVTDLTTIDVSTAAKVRALSCTVTHTIH